MKIRWIALVAALALSACSSHDETPAQPIAAAATPTASTTPQPTVSTAPPVITGTIEANPYELNIPTAAHEATEWSEFVTDAKERIVAKFGPNDVTQEDVQIAHSDDGTRVVTIKLKGKAGQVEIYPQGEGVDPYVYYTSGPGEPNLAIMQGVDPGFASSSTDAHQRSAIANQLAARLLDELLPKK